MEPPVVRIERRHRGVALNALLGETRVPSPAGGRGIAEHDAETRAVALVLGAEIAHEIDAHFERLVPGLRAADELHVEQVEVADELVADAPIRSGQALQGQLFETGKCHVGHQHAAVDRRAFVPVVSGLDRADARVVAVHQIAGEIAGDQLQPVEFVDRERYWCPLAPTGRRSLSHTIGVSCSGNSVLPSSTLVVLAGCQRRKN